MSTLQSEGNAGVGQLIRYPWPHLIVDNFLTSALLTQSLLEISANRDTYDMEPRGAGRIEYSLLKSETLWRAIYSASTVSLLSNSFGVELKLNKHNMLQLRRMNEDTPEFPLHDDFTSDEDTIASFLYLSDKWSRRCGGRLLLFESNEQRRPVVSIDPIQNRFIAFRTSASHWHSVEKVYGWERFSVLSLWNVEDPNTP